MKKTIADAHDPVTEVRRVREEIFAEHGFDLDAYCAHLRRTQGQTGRKVVNLFRRRKRSAASPA